MTDVLTYPGLQSYDEKIKRFAVNKDSIVQENADKAIGQERERIGDLELNMPTSISESEIDSICD